MKYILFIIIAICSITSWGQNLEYSSSDYFIRINSKDETFSTRDKKQIGNFALDKSSTEAFINIHKGYLTNKQLELLKGIVLGVSITINYMGEIVKVDFMTKKEALKIVSENDFRNLYNAYRRLKIDLNTAEYYEPFNKDNYVKFYYGISRRE